MPPFFKKFAPKTKVVVALDSSGLFVAHYRSYLLGWAKVREAEVSFSEPLQELAQVADTLRQACASWKLSGDVWASWILPSDIVSAAWVHGQDKGNGNGNGNSRGNGQSSSAALDARSASADIAALLPFPLAEVCVSALQPAAVAAQTLWWAHQDWVTELQRISTSLNWTCTELFARAQLFSADLSRARQTDSLVLDGRAGELFLHLFSAEGVLQRTSKLLTNEPSMVSARIARELATGAVIDVAPVAVSAAARQLWTSSTWPDALALRGAGLFPKPLPALGLAQRVDRLMRSSQAGIELSAISGYVVDRINFYSVMLLILAGCGLMAVVWHDGQLQESITKGRAQLRKDAPRFQAAQWLRGQTLKMADAVRIKDDLTREPSAFRPLAEILQSLPPSTHLLAYAVQDVRVSLVAQGEATATQVALQKNKSFTAIKGSRVDDPLQAAKKKVFGLQASWLVPVPPKPSSPAVRASSSASGAAS